MITPNPTETTIQPFSSTCTTYKKAAGPQICTSWSHSKHHLINILRLFRLTIGQDKGQKQRASRVNAGQILNQEFAVDDSGIYYATSKIMPEVEGSAYQGAASVEEHVKRMV